MAGWRRGETVGGVQVIVRVVIAVLHQEVSEGMVDLDLIEIVGQRVHDLSGLLSGRREARSARARAVVAELAEAAAQIAVEKAVEDLAQSLPYFCRTTMQAEFWAKASDIIFEPCTWPPINWRLRH
jgi:hypothetical protein